jgi:YgiT-type zinc finger domain-containing protein
MGGEGEKGETMIRWTDELEARWRQLSEDVLVGMKEWRQAHPKATLREIETALDEKLAKVRARMLADVALVSPATDLVASQERVNCPQCGQEMEAHGQEERTLTTTGNQDVVLRRSYAVCPACGAGLFPPR